MKSERPKSVETDTIAGIFEKNVKQIIKKRESFLPFYVKGFSDAHREYNKCVEQAFKVMKVNEERYFGKSNEEIVKMYEKYVNAWFKAYLLQVDTSKEIMSGYFEACHSFTKLWNDHLRKIADGYQEQNNPPRKKL